MPTAPAASARVPARVRATVECQLERIERAHDVKVVLAVARGSHAWGGASPASDYDVGFVFAPTDLRQYAHLERPDDTLVTQFSGEDDVDYQGWNVRKFASLLAGSNDGALDLVRSPIRYRVACEPSVLDELRTYVEHTYNPMDLYHAYRGIAASNYRKYISHHLVRTDDELFPIVERSADGYVVERATDEPSDGTASDDTTTMTIAADDDRFTETQTKPTVKRNLTIYRAAMAARYLQATGECGAAGDTPSNPTSPTSSTSHDLPALEFDQFLTEQAPAVFDTERIERAWDLLERKRRGEGEAMVGDVVGREFAHPSVEIEPAIHARSGPEPARLDEFTDALLAAVL
ncbi:nucleotidyltransferase [Natrialba hulunbeirensis JCM 10989]|uniref:Nucleotidyltransferase n=1 Tax=Natrialba hulunbeirensis JCM 10989 TaxID=1227493 RepID=L9ZZ45_9EURY|nr:nucleotidyltransferase domain-containing protein [Natrialba hulunbeirensis]ELY90403.1 nucleotidyltransferase [Natrialba hulunbeirensis JCM 10989]